MYDNEDVLQLRNDDQFLLLCPEAQKFQFVL